MGSWAKWPWWQGWKLFMGSATQTSTHQGHPDCDHCWMSSLHQRPTTQHYTRVISQFVPWWQVDYIGPLPSWEGQHFVLIGIDTYTNTFPVHSASSKTTIHGFLEWLVHTADSGTQFTVKEVWQCSQSSLVSSELCDVPYHPEAVGLLEQWNGLLRTQLWCLLSSNTLQGWFARRLSVYALNQHPNIWYCFSHCQDSWVQESRNGDGSDHSLWAPVIH